MAKSLGGKTSAASKIQPKAAAFLLLVSSFARLADDCQRPYRDLVLTSHQTLQLPSQIRLQYELSADMT
jgi:hypothetical protein